MDKLGKKLVSIEDKLGGSQPMPANVQDPLGWHLNYIETLLENGGGGSGVSSNFVDLTSFGKFNILEKVEWNSIEHPEILPVVKGLFDSYSADKITIVKLYVDAGEEDQDITVTASDTAVHIEMPTTDIIQIFAANFYRPTGGGDPEGIYPEIQFAKIDSDGTIIYALNVSFYIGQEGEPEGEGE